MTLSILLYPPGGDLVLLSPKCHPEIAGVGIEYCIGFSKQRFRRVHNDTVNANLLDNVRKSLDTHNELTFEHVWRFARRSRDYLHVYRNILSSGVDKTKGVVDLTGSVGFAKLEEMRDSSRNHRNIHILDRKFIEHCAGMNSEVPEKKKKRRVNKILP